MINFKKLIILPIMACYMIRGGEAAVPVPGWYDAEGQRQVRILEKKLLGNCKTVAVELIKEDVSTQLHLRRAPGSAQTPIIVDTNGPPSIKEMVPVIIHLHKLKHRMRALTREAQATGRALKGGEGLDFRYVSSREAREGGAPIGGMIPIL